MLLPHDLKRDNFTKVMRGYSVGEVDDYIDFIIEKYTELYRENDELERKLKAALSRLDEIHDGEEQIRTTLLNARRAADKMIEEANQRSDVIVESAMNRCDTILRDFEQQLTRSRGTLAEVKKEIKAFKTALYVKYNEHIDEIERLTDFLDDDQPNSVYTSQVIEGVKDDLENMIAASPDEEDGLSDNVPAYDETLEAAADESPAPAEEESFGGTPDGDFIEEEGDELYVDDEPMPSRAGLPRENTPDEDRSILLDEEDAQEFAEHAKMSLFGRKNGAHADSKPASAPPQAASDSKKKKSDPLTLTDEFELVYSNEDDDIPN